MNRKFAYSKHIMLWKHMAKEKTIERIVERTKEDMATDNDNNYLMYINQNIVVEKRTYIRTMFNEHVANSCYACEVDVPCSECPIKIGRCTNGLYEKYMYAISNYAETNSKEYLDEAIQLALDIAHAELNKEAIEYYNIEVV